VAHLTPDVDGMLPRAEPDDTLSAHFLAEGDRPAAEVAGWMAGFIRGARASLDIALYDCRLDDGTVAPIAEALRDRMDAGVRIRLVFDAGERKPQGPADLDAIGADPAEQDTHERVAELGLPPEVLRPCRGQGLMHHKYIVRDGEYVWTGSMNWSHDSMERMENTLLTLWSPDLAAHYARDFAQLFATGEIAASGAFPTEPSTLRMHGVPTQVDVDFSPGQGQHINEWVARRVREARRRVVICSMLFTSSKLLNALLEQLDRRQIELWGVIDETQMAGVLHQWQGNPQLAWKVDAVRRIVREARLVGKRSVPYSPGQRHNFMHNKLLVVDNVVITGSYNLSHNAQGNAENMLAITSAAFATDVLGYADVLARRYEGGNDRGPTRET
jgi:phosphatidylserine/phosphatidylglycerophosphate/cardiolipin synthase-like enzyme